MNLEIKECILDAYDSVMDSFYKSPEYQEQQREFDEMYSDFKAGLTPEQSRRFITLINARGDLESVLVLEAFFRGFVNGIELRNDAK